MSPTSSWYAHGEPTLFGEVFRNLKDELDWNLTEDYTSFDTLTVLGAVNVSLSKFIVKVCAAYGFGPNRLRSLNEQIETNAFINRNATLTRILRHAVRQRAAQGVLKAVPPSGRYRVKGQRADVYRTASNRACFRTEMPLA